MHPAADDNYGVDACAIICLQSHPPILAISTCTGTIYHGVLLTENDDIVTVRAIQYFWYKNYFIIIKFLS